MSLRDQLLKAGVVNKKKVRQANRQLKKKRRTEQGDRQSKKALARAAKAAHAQKMDARKAEVEAEKARIRAIREREAERKAVQMWLRTHRVPPRAGNQLFFHRSARGPRLVRCSFPESVVHELRSGRLAIAWDGPSSSAAEYVLLPDSTALRLKALAPERIIFFNEEPPGPDDPAEQPYNMGDIALSRERVPDRWSGLR